MVPAPVSRLSLRTCPDHPSDDRNSKPAVRSTERRAQLQGVQHRLRVRRTVTGPVEGSAVVDRCADNRQTKGDIDPAHGLPGSRGLIIPEA